MVGLLVVRVVITEAGVQAEDLDNNEDTNDGQASSS